ncbi:class I SAM-dependent methyltransferase [Vibrio alginolyticus]|uniref:class I SAM-dependent methyltransferase n=3 Tax=Vibrio harveyi group TaxID=717610 RepID=UPI0011ED3D9F|nr:class I SAM-dependent methyltransferase [Vibrio alginolyticus]TYZ34186.1 class I SAM-dependent methyltransferase [Vibrio alginolyticus]
MSRELSNPEQYSELWTKESEFLELHGIYEKLSHHTPKGNTLEFGCGTGKGTRYLSNGRSVLSLDSNQYLIDAANSYLEGLNVSRNIHKCDFFELTTEDKKAIKTFSPKVITGWFVGSHGQDIFKHTPEEPDPVTKSKLYREKIEDIIVSKDVCLESVDYIHLVNRGGIIEGFSDSEIFSETKKDYDTYVFGNVGFEVVEVKNYEWPRVGSEFQYGQAHNPNLAKGKAIPMITSIVAKRKSK